MYYNLHRDENDGRRREGSSGKGSSPIRDDGIAVGSHDAETPITKNTARMDRDESNRSSMNSARSSEEDSYLSGGFLTWDHRARGSSEHDPPSSPTEEATGQSQHVPGLTSTAQVSSQQTTRGTRRTPQPQRAPSINFRRSNSSGSVGSASLDGSYRSTHSLTDTRNPGSTQNTPFRPMKPREFSLGSSLRRNSNPSAPLPRLPADIGEGKPISDTEQKGRQKSEGSNEITGDESTSWRKQRQQHLISIRNVPVATSFEGNIKRPLQRRLSTQSGVESSMGRISEGNSEESNSMRSSKQTSPSSVSEGVGKMDDDKVGDGMKDPATDRAGDDRNNKFWGAITSARDVVRGQLDRLTSESNNPPPVELTPSQEDKQEQEEAAAAAAIKSIEGRAKMAMEFEQPTKTQNRSQRMRPAGELTSSQQSSLEDMTKSDGNLLVYEAEKEFHEEPDAGARMYTTPSASPLKSAMPVKRPFNEVIAGTTMHVSPITPGPLGFGRGVNNVSASDTSSMPHKASNATATSRFDKLLQECRQLAKTCDGSTYSSDNDQTNSQTTSNRSPSVHQSLNNDERSVEEGISSKEQQQHMLRTALQRNAIVDAAAISSTAPRSQVIDTSNNETMHMSNITMDPELLASLRASGFGASLNQQSSGTMNFRSSDMRLSPPVVDTEVQEVATLNIKEELKKSDFNMPPASPATKARNIADGAAILAATAMGEVMGESESVSITGTARTDGDGHLTPISRERAMSDLSMGVDAMYGESPTMCKGSGENTETHVDEETASFNPTKFQAVLTDRTSSPIKTSHHSMGVVSELTLSDRDYAAPTTLELPDSMKDPLLQRRQENIDRMKEVVASATESAKPKEEITIETATGGEASGTAAMTSERVFRPAEEIARRQYSWLSYSTKEESPKSSSGNPKSASSNETKGTPPSTKTSPLEDDELHILPKKSSAVESQHSTDESEASGGLLVGFGQQRRKGLPEVPSEPSDISSSSSETTSDNSDSDSSFGSGSGGSSSSSGSGSSSSSGETASSSEESDSPPASRLIVQDSQSDLVSELSFGGASALMHNAQMLAMRGSMTRATSRRAISGGGFEQQQATINFSTPSQTKLYSKPPGGSNSSPSSASKSSPENESQSNPHNEMASPLVHPKSTKLDNSRLGMAAVEVQTLEKLDEVSESNASFLDDISSIVEPNTAVEKFLSKPAVDAQESGVWSSFASTADPPMTDGALQDKKRPPKAKPKSSSSSKSSLFPSSSSNITSSEESSIMQSLHSEGTPIKSPVYPPAPPSDITQKQEIGNPPSSSSIGPSSTASKSNQSQSRHHSSDRSHSSGSYYDGAVARHKAAKRSSISSTSLRSSSSSSRHGQWQEQDLTNLIGGGYRSVENARSLSSTSSSRIHNGPVERESRADKQELGNVDEELHDVKNSMGESTQQGSGESPLENMHPNVEELSAMSSSGPKSSNSREYLPTLPAATAQARADNLGSTSSKVSSSSKHSQRDFAGESIEEPSSNHQALDGVDAASAVLMEDFPADYSRKPKVVGVESDVGTSPKQSGMLERLREELVQPSATHPSALPPDPLPQTDAVSDKSNRSNLSKKKKDFDIQSHHSRKSAISNHDDTSLKEEELYEDFPSRISDEDGMKLRQVSSLRSQRSLPVNVETDARKPWITATREEAASVGPESIGASSRPPSQASNPRLDYQDKDSSLGGSREPRAEQNQELQSEGDWSESEQINALKVMGLYGTADDISVEKDPEIVRLHLPASSDGSSSISEWDFTGKTKTDVALPPKNDDVDVISDGYPQSNASDRGMDQNKVEGQDTDRLETFFPTEEDASKSLKRGESQNEEANKKSATSFASAPQEMTNLLRQSLERRSLQETNFDELYGSSSETSDNDFVNTVMALRAMADSDRSGEVNFMAAGSPVGNVRDDESSIDMNETKQAVNASSTHIPQEKSMQDSDVREFTDKKETNEPPMPSLDVAPLHSLDESKDGIEHEGPDIIHMLTSFKKRNSLRLDPDGDYTEDVGTSKPASAEPSFVRSHSSFVRRYSAMDQPPARTASTPAPNPFLADSSEEDEELGVSPQKDVLPLSIGHGDDDGPKAANDDVAGKSQSWYEKDQKSWILWIALVIIIVVIAIIAVTISRKNNPSGPSNPSVRPPPNPQTAPPTRLPTTPNAPDWVQVGGGLEGESPGDEAGFSVSASESGRVIIGARRNGKDGMKNRGSARIFEFDSNTGFYVPINDIYGEMAGDQCGFSVAMSRNGKRVAVGSLGSDKKGQNSGQVRIYDENELSNTWTLVAELFGEQEFALFGASVSLSQDGSHVAIGAPYHDEGDVTRSGRAYVYRQAQESEWEQVGGHMYGASNDALFGWSVSLLPNAKLVAVGAPRLESTLDSGYVQVFSLEAGAWEVEGGTMSLGVTKDRFGFSVSLVGDDTFQRVAIGAPGMSLNGKGSGQASVYENVGDGWRRAGDDLIGEGWGESLGYAVSMTPDASRMVVGVPNKKLDGVPVGQVRVLDVKPGTDLLLQSAGETHGQEDEKFGVSVAVSPDGETIYGGASMANLVRVYGEI